MRYIVLCLPAYTTAFNGDVDVTVFEWFELELLLLEVGPLLLIFDHETLSGVWVRHLDDFLVEKTCVVDVNRTEMLDKLKHKSPRMLVLINWPCALSENLRALGVRSSPVNETASCIFDSLRTQCRRVTFIGRVAAFWNARLPGISHSNFFFLYSSRLGSALLFCVNHISPSGRSLAEDACLCPLRGTHGSSPRVVV